MTFPLTRPEFLERYPEFDSAEATLIDARLAQAARSIDSAVYGEQAEDAHGLLAAHLLAMSPFGQQASMRLGAGANATSVYWADYTRLQRRAGSSHRTTA